MDFLIDIALLVLLCITAIAAIRLQDLFAVTMLFGIYSFITATFFLSLDAIDVAFTEAAVGGGVTTVLMLATLRLTGRYEQPTRHSRVIPLLVVSITAAALIYGTSDAPLLGDPQAPAHLHVAPRYIEQSPKEIGIPNMVTSVLASYRGYDTLGETFVIFGAGLAVVIILGIHDSGEVRPGHSAIGNQLVLRVVVKLLLPFILIFGLYVQLHGDYGAGGGFQAGVIFASGFILYDLVFGEGDARLILPPHWLQRLAALGVLLYASVGLYSLFQGKHFLDYSALASDPVSGQHLGIFLVEMGVGVTVFSVVLTIFYAFSGRARIRHSSDRGTGQ